MTEDTAREIRNKLPPDRQWMVPYMRGLLYLHAAMLAVLVLKLIPVTLVAANVLEALLTLAAAWCLFRLRPAHKGYRLAAILSVAGMLGGFFDQRILFIVFSLCTLVAVYQEYHAHSALVVEVAHDHVLSKKWSDLFIWELLVGIFAGMLLTGFLVAFLATQDQAAAVVTIVVSVLNLALAILLRVLYLLYLKRTISHLQTDEPWVIHD